MLNLDWARCYLARLDCNVAVLDAVHTALQREIGRAYDEWIEECIEEDYGHRHPYWDWYSDNEEDF
jgi:hypothetical protein